MRKILGALIAVGLIATVAVIAEAKSGPSGHDHDRMARHDDASWRKDACNERYAHAAARFAFLQARLSLSASQQPLFDKWEDTVQQRAKTREQSCLTRTAQTDHRPDALDLMDRARERLKTRLADLDSQWIPFQALYKSLAPEQQQVLDRAAFRIAGGHGERFGGWHRGHRFGGGGGDDSDRPQDGQGAFAPPG